MPRVLITGCNRGIGLELTRQYLKAGWQVIATAREPANALKLKELWRAHQDDLRIYALNVADHVQLDALARELGDETLDVLINNAGAMGPQPPLGQLDYVEWNHLFAVNTMAPAKMVEAFGPLVGRGQRKLIVNISTRMASMTDNSSGGAYAYRSTKAALNAVTKSLAIDLAPDGITVIAVHPGWVKTDMGGDGAPLPVPDSAAALRALFDRVGPAESGRFFNYDGQVLPW